jgi:hypothetical protein
MPYGSTQPENLEQLSDTQPGVNRPGGHGSEIDGPLFIFYDQEPILGEFNYPLFDVLDRRVQNTPHILVTTEQNSDPLDSVKQRYGWRTCYYFHHAFAAADWFRGYRYDPELVDPAQRKLDRKYITFNRLTSDRRVYRSLLISELIEQDLLHQGHVSYNDICPEGSTYQENLARAVSNGYISTELAQRAINNISSAQLPLRIDYQDQAVIPNHSFVLSAVAETQRSFCYLVTETCYWERKDHLTEKIFKPIVSRMPFVLAGPAHNLKYLRSYGFQTFDRWWDESYDDIEDPVARLTAIGQVMKTICGYSLSQLEHMLAEMAPVLEHNLELFYSREFLDRCWQELTTNLAKATRS